MRLMRTRRGQAAATLAALVGVGILTGAARDQVETQGSPTSDATTIAVLRLAEAGLPLYCGGSTPGRFVALTFDDGPGAYTDQTVRTLQRFGARATFFDIGRQVRYFPDAVRRSTEVGTVGDHTWTHPHLAKLRARRIAHELVWTDVALRQTLLRPIVLFRPPYASRDERVDWLARTSGFLQVLWSIDTRDSLGATPAQIVKRVLRYARPGSIVLMHENHPGTQAALPWVLRGLAKRGLRSVTVPELLVLDPPSRGQLRLGVGGCPGGVID